MRTFSLDMIPGGAQTAVACNQYESGDTWVFALYYDGGRYSIPQDATVSITGTKPDGAAYNVAGVIEDNAVVITVSEQMTACEGRSVAEILVESETDGTVLYSANFPLLVEPAAVQGDLSPSEIPAAIVDADGNVYYSAEDFIDDTLTEQGKAADAKAVGDAIASAGQGSGLTEDVKVALLNCFAHTAWVDAHGQDYYDALEEALYPPANLISIIAVYTQSGDVYDNQTLDSLRGNLVVTARYDNGTSAPVTAYTLSGTLATGTSTITVAYGGKTATFTVVVTHAVTQYSITNVLTNCTNSNSTAVINAETAYSGTITANSGYYVDDTDITVTMGGTDVTSTALSNGVITIASVTGDVVITATAIDALYPLKNGTFTFSNGDSVTVTGHKHVEIDLVGNSGVRYVNFSDISENTATSTDKANVRNHPKKFTISAGSTAVFTIENLVIPSAQISFNAIDTGTTAYTIDITNVHTGGPYTATMTPSEDADCGCLFAVPFAVGKNTFDVSFTVDGVKYV